MDDDVIMLSLSFSLIDTLLIFLVTTVKTTLRDLIFQDKKENKLTIMNKNTFVLQILLLLALCVAYVSASATPDAFFMELDHDLHDVRDKRLKRDT